MKSNTCVRGRTSIFAILLFVLVIACTFDMKIVSADDVAIMDEAAEATTSSEAMAAATAAAESSVEDATDSLKINAAEAVEAVSDEVEDSTEEAVEEVEVEEKTTGEEPETPEGDGEGENEAFDTGDEDDSSGPLDAIKNMVENASKSATSVVDGIKSVNVEDAKKAVAAAIGIWGGATGVGWYMQRGNAE